MRIDLDHAERIAPFAVARARAATARLSDRMGEPFRLASAFRLYFEGDEWLDFSAIRCSNGEPWTVCYPIRCAR